MVEQILPFQSRKIIKRIPDEVFKAIADTLEVFISYWNCIDEMYSNIKQREHKSTDQLDQCIKDTGRKIPVQNWRWENGTLEQSCFSMQQSILK